MLKALLVTPVTPLELAESLYPVPALSIDSPGNVATPLEAFTVAVPDSVPLPGLVPIAIVTLAELDVTVLAKASCNVTAGDGVIELPEAVFVGCALNTSALALAAPMVKLLLPIPVRP